MKTELEAMAWVKAARVRLRENGHLFFGEALVVPSGGSVSPKQVKTAEDRLRALDWRVADVVVSPVPELPHEWARDEQKDEPGVR